MVKSQYVFMDRGEQNKVGFRNLLSRIAVAGFWGIGFSGSGWALGSLLARSLRSPRNAATKKFVVDAATIVAGTIGGLYGWFLGEGPACDTCAKTEETQHDIADNRGLAHGLFVRQLEQKSIDHEAARADFGGLSR